MFGLKDDEILTCLLLIIVGYIIAKMFSRCEGFSVGIEDITLCPTDSRNPVDSCIRCQLIDMGEAACYTGYCPECGRIPRSIGRLTNYPNLRIYQLCVL